MGLGLGRQIDRVDVAFFIALDRNDPHPGHHGTGGIGPVGTGGDQTDATVAFPATLMPSPNNHQPGILALGAGIWLEGNPGKAGDSAKPGLQIRYEPGIAPCLVRRGEGMDLAEGGPTDGRQFGRRIQFHGAATQGDHAVHQG